MMNKKLSYFLFSLIALTGCTYNSVEIEDFGPAVTYEIDIKPILVNNCYQCHSDTSTNPAAGGIPPNSHWDHMDDLQRVAKTPDSGNPSYTILEARILGIGVDQMPLNAPPLDPLLIQKIRKWVQEGAPNN